VYRALKMTRWACWAVALLSIARGGLGTDVLQQRRTFSASKTFGELYERYADGLAVAIAEAAAFCAQPGQPGCLSDAVEMEIAYLRIRHARPGLVWEASPHHGYSSTWILRALEDNHHGRLVSFDLINKADPFVMKHRRRWSFVVGDFRQTFPLQAAGGVLPDYLLLDSFHSAAFGQFYVSTVFPAFHSHTLVSIHDVFNSAFWSDTQRGRNLTVYPAYLPNEEGIIILSWLAFQEDKSACRVFTFARERAPTELHELAEHRKIALGNSSMLDVTAAMNPTLFFELNCQRT